MDKQEKDLLWGLAAIGILALLTRKSNKQLISEKEPSLEGLPIGFRKIGEITSKMAKKLNESHCLSFRVKPGPVVVTELFYQHIKKKHTEGFYSFHEIDSYVKSVANNYNQIWLGSENSILLVEDAISKDGKHYYKIIAIQMYETIDDEGKACWNVHTAQSRYKQSHNRITLWKK